MTTEEKLKIYELVNSCESYLGLANIIRSLADKKGMIQGRNREFNAERMAKACEKFEVHSPNLLTREFGIRQQALYIKNYS